jgi:hypothetical protein
MSVRRTGWYEQSVGGGFFCTNVSTIGLVGVSKVSVVVLLYKCQYSRIGWCEKVSVVVLTSGTKGSSIQVEGRTGKQLRKSRAAKKLGGAERTERKCEMSAVNIACLGHSTDHDN